jgi:superfamily II DNA or RNA helicase
MDLSNLYHCAPDGLMPISWKGTLQQYAGRLHREHATKTDVRIIDFVDTGHPALLRMWDKRQCGYRAMGYKIARESGSSELFETCYKSR